MPVSGILRKLRALVQRRRAERELRDELEFHVGMQARKHMQAGMGPAEARRRARAEFGSVELAKDDARDVRGRFQWPSKDFLQDIRISVRGFVRTPVFALTVLLTISLGLGLNTAVFTAFDAYVLRPFAVRDPHGLVDFVWRDHRGFTHALTWPQYQRFRERNPAFSESLAYMNMVARLDGRPVFGQFVTGDLLRQARCVARVGPHVAPVRRDHARQRRGNRDQLFCLERPVRRRFLRSREDRRDSRRPARRRRRRT